MDLSHLLCGFKPLDATDRRRKREALLFAFERWKEIRPKVTLDEFMRLVPPTILGERLGSSANDYYITALMSCAAQSGDTFDSFAGAVLNRIVLQLNFQTRFIHSLGAPEILVLDGASELFPLALANGNAVFGFLVDENSAARIPEWSNCSHIDLSVGAMFWRRLDDFPGLMKSVQRDRVGCLALNIPNGSDEAQISIHERFSVLATNFFNDSYFVLVGSPETVLSAASTLERSQPEARIALRVYDADTGERRAILVASGLSRLPELILQNA